MKKAWIGLIVIISIFGVMLATIIAKREYIFTKDKFYTQEEVDTVSEKVREETKIEYADDTLLDKLDSLSIQRMELLIEKENLETQNKGLEATISELRTQIKTLEIEKASLEKQHNTNTETISNLIIQISELETQILTLENEKTQLNNELILKQSTIEEYEKTIEQLQNSIDAYKNYIDLSDKTNLIASFLVDNYVVDIQNYNINECISPSIQIESTSERVFNGWTLNNELVDFNTFHITNSCTFVADFDYSVVFLVNNNIYDTQFVNNGNYPIEPTQPCLESYLFKGWSLDGQNIIEDISEFPIGNSTTFIAVFDIFKWNISDDFGSIDFITDAKYIWNIGSQYYYSEGLDKQYYLDKSTNTWEIKIWDGFSDIYGNDIWYGYGNDIYYSTYKDGVQFHYKYSISEKTWSSFSFGVGVDVSRYFYGRYVWNYNSIIFYSSPSVWDVNDDAYYTLMYSTGWHSFDSLCFNGNDTFNVFGTSYWFSNNRMYYFINSRLDVERNYTFKIEDCDDISLCRGYNVWTDGVYTFCSIGSKHYIAVNNTTEIKWQQINWVDSNEFKGSQVFNINGNYYYISDGVLYKKV